MKRGTVRFLNSEDEMLLKRTDEFGNTIYSFSNVRKGVKTKLHEVRQLSMHEIAWRRVEYTKKARIHWYELTPLERKINKINRLSKNKFIRDFAKLGHLYEHFASEVVEDACNGFSPDNFDLHHVVPIALGGKDVLRNMVLVHKNAHKPFLHKRVFDLLHNKIQPQPADKEIPNGEKVFVEIPVFPYVLTEQTMRLIFTDYAEYEDERNRLEKAEIAQGTDNECTLDKCPKTLAEQIKEKRERGELPPDPTKGAPTVRVVKKGCAVHIKRMRGR